jgi:hypothetical protein
MKACIKMFDQFKSYEGLFFLLGAYVGIRFVFQPSLSSVFSLAPEIHTSLTCNSDQ